MSKQVRHSKAYDRLAQAAGKTAGLPAAGRNPNAVAEDPAARQIRDGLWAEYEIRLRDTQTYTIDELVEWLGGQGAVVGRTSAHRDRDAILAAERSLTLSAARAKGVCEAIDEMDEGDLLRGQRVIAGQLIFNTLSQLTPEALTEMTPTQIIKLMDCGTRLGKSHAETELLNMKIDEMAKEAKAETDKLAARSADRKLTATDVYKMIDKVMRGES